MVGWLAITYNVTDTYTIKSLKMNTTLETTEFEILKCSENFKSALRMFVWRISEIPRGRLKRIIRLFDIFSICEFICRYLKKVHMHSSPLQTFPRINTT